MHEDVDPEIKYHNLSTEKFRDLLKHLHGILKKLDTKDRSGASTTSDPDYLYDLVSFVQNMEEYEYKPAWDYRVFSNIKSSIPKAFHALTIRDKDLPKHIHTKNKLSKEIIRFRLTGEQP